MHIAYTEKQRWITQWGFCGHTILCEIREDGHTVVTFALPVKHVEHDCIPVRLWDYARARTWAAYARYRARQAARTAGEKVPA